MNENFPFRVKFLSLFSSILLIDLVDGGGQQPTSENRFTEEDAAPHRPATVDEVD